MGGGTTRRLPHPEEPADDATGRPSPPTAPPPAAMPPPAAPTVPLPDPADPATPTTPIGGLASQPPSSPTPDRGTTRRRPFSDRDLPVAIATGLLLAGVFLGTIFWHPAAFSLLVAALVVLGTWETSRVFRDQGVRVVAPVVLGSALVLLVGAYRAGAGGQALGIAVLFAGAVVWELADARRTDVVVALASTVLLGLWIPFLASFAVVLIQRPVDGWVATLATIGVAVVSDVGAYVVGSKLGRRKLAPTISPGKTWEGAVGGVAVAAVLAAIILPLLGSADLFDPLTAILFTLPVAAAGVIGDLAESLVKRGLGVKDFGGFIPGHGGVLDRVDGVLFALPTGHYVLSVLAG